MDSDDDNDFANKGGEALELGDDDFSDGEGEYDDQEDQPQMEDPKQVPKQNAPDRPTGGSPSKDVKGEVVENQPFDLAVDVNDSEEIDSDEEEDEVNAGAPEAPK
jgi:hypothetical protein